jgi:hypothetical protein
MASAAAGCDALSGGGDDDRSYDWLIDAPEGDQLVPGQWLNIGVDDVDIDPTQLRLWVDDVPFVPIRLVTRDLPEGQAILRMPLPVLEARAVRLAVGTETEIKTAKVEYDVVIPTPRLSREEAASAMSRGFRGMVLETRRAFEEDPDVARVFEEKLGAANVAGILDVMDQLGPVADQVGAYYAALPADLEPGYQAFLDNSGLLPFLEGVASLQMIPLVARPDVVTLEDRLTHKTARVLYYLDATSATLAALSDVVALLNIAALLGPGTQALAPVGVTGKIVIAVLRAIIDSWIPTDLVKLDGQVQPILFQGESSEWVYWGNFEPQNGFIGGQLTVWEQITSIVISEGLLPKQFGTPLEAVVRDLMTRVIRLFPNLPARMAELNSGFHDSHIAEWKIMVNMQAYDLTLGDLSSMVPMFGILLREISFLIDFELLSPFDVTAADPSWAEDAEFSMDYAQDSATVSDVDFPAGTDPRANLTIEAEGYRFKNHYLLLANPPWPEFVTTTDTTQARRAPISGEPNDVLSDEAYLVDSLVPNADGSKSEPILDNGTRGERTVRVTVRNLRGESFGGETRIDIVVNGQLFTANRLVTSAGEQLVLNLQPDRNTVVIRVVQGHVTPGDDGRHAAIVFGVPDARNADKAKGMYLDPGGSLELAIYTPPRFSK